MMNDKFNKPAPAANNQKLTAFRRGKATSRAPICSGITIFIKPITNGMAINKIINKPCVVNISL
ncbi:hypothetical protein D3C79_956250 [compost metagenome]